MLGQLINKGHELLSALGVSNDTLESLTVFSLGVVPVVYNATKHEIKQGLQAYGNRPLARLHKLGLLPSYPKAEILD